jgi:hypothetical protein
MDIYAPLAGRMGMQWMREELEDLAFRVLNPEARNSIIRRFLTLQREIRRRDPQDHRRHPAELEKAGSRPRSTAAPRSPIRSGARCRRRSWPSRACPTSTASASSCDDRGRVLPHPRRDPPALAGGAGAVQGLHQPAQVERLPLDPHHRLGPRRQAGGGADPHPRDARGGRGRRRRALGLPRRRAHREPLRRRSGEVDRDADRTARQRGPRRVPRARQARDVFRPGVLLHAQGRRGAAAARRDAAGFRLCDPHADRQRLRLGQGRRAARAALDAAEERPVGRDHHRRGPAPAGDLDRHRRTGRAKAAIRRSLREEDRERFVKLGANWRAWPSSTSGARSPTRRWTPPPRRWG